MILKYEMQAHWIRRVMILLIVSLSNNSKYLIVSPLFLVRKERGLASPAQTMVLYSLIIQAQV